MRAFVTGLGISTLILMSGCGGKGRTFVEVSGTVKMDDKPLKNAKVTFQPISDAQGNTGALETGPSSYGITDEEGRFVLKVMTTEEKGAVIAKHRVLITTNRDPGEETGERADVEAPPEKIPVRYNGQSKLEFTVEEGGTESANFNLTSKKDMRDRKNN